MVMFDIKRFNKTENVSMCGVPSGKRTGLTHWVTPINITTTHMHILNNKQL